MNNIEQREIVLVPWRYSDDSEIEPRPTLVISNTTYNEKHLDVMLCFITSQPKQFDYSVEITNNDMEKGTLKRDSKIVPSKILIRPKDMIITRFGKIKIEKYNQVINNLKKLVECPQTSIMAPATKSN